MPDTDDWTSIFGDPTKFGLGIITILFDLTFMLQHYVLYRNAIDPDKVNRKVDHSSHLCNTDHAIKVQQVSEENRRLLDSSQEGERENKSQFQRLRRFCRIA